MPASAKRIVVFDFDQTLAADEISMLTDKAMLIDRGFGGAERVAMLHALLRALTGEHKATLAVCSLNSRHTIRLALSACGLADFFETSLIFDRTDFMRAGSLKSQVIAKFIMPKVIGSSPAHTLFVDDALEHIKDVQLRLRAVSTVHVPRPGAATKFGGARGSALLPLGGIREAQCEEILAWANRAAPAADALPPRADASAGGSGLTFVGRAEEILARARRTAAPASDAAPPRAAAASGGSSSGLWVQRTL